MCHNAAITLWWFGEIPSSTKVWKAFHKLFLKNAKYTGSDGLFVTKRYEKTNFMAQVLTYFLLPDMVQEPSKYGFGSQADYFGIL